MDFLTVTQSLLEGFALTCILFVLTLILSLPLGLIISFCTMSKFKPLKIVFKVIVWVVRGIPLMLQLFIVYYLPGMLSKTGLNIFGQMDNTLYFKYGIENGGAFIATLIAFVLNYACYFSEIFRGGIESIPKGQYEAGSVLGLSKNQTFFKIILPQVIKRIIPSIANEVITLVKDTSLARVIAMGELIQAAEEIMIIKGVLWPLLYTGIFYLVFSGLLTILFNKLEKKLDYYKI